MEFLFISLLLHSTAFLWFVSKLSIFYTEKKYEMIMELKRFTSKQVLEARYAQHG